MLRLRHLAVFLGFTLALCLLGPGSARTQTGALRRVTNTSAEGLSINPSLSGDGRRIAFESTEDVARAGGNDRFRAIRADISTNPATFVQMGGTRAPAPGISQDGSIIAFAAKENPLGTNADGNSEIFLFDGATLRQITDTTPGDISGRARDGNFQPSLSDDGRFIAFSSNRNLTNQNADGNLEIFIFDRSANAFSQLTNTTGGVGASDAKISGDATRVAYIRDGNAVPAVERDLMLQDRAGGVTRVLANGVTNLALTYGRAISDDGSRVVYAGDTAANTSQVFLFDGRINAVRQITSLDARETDVPLHPTISGDGTRIAFSTRRAVATLDSNGDHSIELYTFDIPTGQFAQVTDAPREADGFQGSNRVTEVVSSLSDDGSIVAFNFPRCLSGEVESGLENKSEIYVTATMERPTVGALTVLNGVSFGHEPSSTEAVAPDSLAVAMGGVLSFTTEQADKLLDGSFPRTLGGTTVTVNNRAAQISFVSPTQVNFVVPHETEHGTATVVVTNEEGFQSRGTIAVLRGAPGIFTLSGDGLGEGVVLNALTLQPGPFDPSGGQLRLVIFSTGVRGVSLPLLTAKAGGQALTVESVMASPDMPGLDEVRVLVPEELRGAGTVDLVLRADRRDSNPVTIILTGQPRREIVINELLADPPGGLDGDANHDGVRDSSDDEFVELVNATSEDIDIGGYQLRTRSTSATTDTVRHTFAPATIFPAGSAIVVFGGGMFNPNHPAFGGAQIFKASSGGLSLANSGGVVTLRDSTEALVTIFSYGGSTGLSGGANQSLTRSPDRDGNFTLHTIAPGSDNRPFSPGTRVDGSSFATVTVSRTEVAPENANIDAGAKQQFTATAYNANGQPMSGLIFSWESSDPAVATIDENGLATGVNEGTTGIRASARGVRSAPVTLTVRIVPRVLTRIEVAPSAATIPAGGTQQFTARGLDQFGNEMEGLAFVWESTNENVATVDENGLATAAGQGQTTIKASSQAQTNTATLNVTQPIVIFNEALADPPGSAGTDLQGDANHDGVRSASADEFIELVNSAGEGVDISGWTLRTRALDGATENLRHTFAANTTLPASSAIVVFGGGDFDPANEVFGCAQVSKASSGRLSLTNSGLTIIVRDAAGNLITQFTYGSESGLSGGADQSLTRAPDRDGDFLLHTTASGADGRRFSPGTKVDGTPFGNCAGRLTSITISPESQSIVVGQSTQFTAQALDQFGRAVTGVTMAFASDDTNVTTVDLVTTDTATGIATVTITGRNQGTAHITAQASDGTTTLTSSQATLTVTPAPPRVTRLDVSPTTATINRGNTQQLTATAFDTNNQPVSGITFTWISSNPAVATVDSHGLATGIGPGATTITATAPDGLGGTVSDTATLTVQVPLIINELLADVPLDNNATTAVIEGDANRDGVRDSSDDEFVELLNNSNASVDISGIVITDSTRNRFTFPANTTLAAGRSLVIFGGGTPPLDDPAFGGALVIAIPGTLSLNDTGDTVSVKLPIGETEVVIAMQSYGEAGGVERASNQSLARSPDAEVGTTGGNFAPHTTATNTAGRIFSPGTRADGTPFGSPPVTRIALTPAAASIFVGSTRDLSARAFSNTSGSEVEVSNVSFIWDSSDTTKATVAPLTGQTTTVTGVAGGSTTMSAQAGGQQNTATLTVQAVVASIELSPDAATIPATNSQTFTVTARDASDNPISGLTFNFSLRDVSPANAATIEATTANTVTVRGNNQGSVTVVASYSRPNDGTIIEDTSVLTITAPPPRMARVEVLPATAIINRGQTQQFTAIAFDGSNQPVPSASFTWSSSDEAATVDSNGLATGVGVGATTITATASDGTGGAVSDTATLNVRIPLVINEILADVPIDDDETANIEGDANRDGARSSGDDEFVELLNNSNAPVDISGVVISDSTSNRFTFKTGTILAAGRAVVIFGGAQSATFNADDPNFGGALVLTVADSASSSSTLSLGNTGETVTVKLPVSGAEVVIASHTYGTEGGHDQSLARSPDAEVGSSGGDFVTHTTATNAAERPFSPGTRADGTPFGSPVITRIAIRPASSSIYVGSTQSFTARAFSNTSGAEVEVHNVAFTWDSSETGKATVAPTTGAATTATGVAAGSTTVRARVGSQQGASALTVKAIVASIKLLPETASIPANSSQTFTVTARDSAGNAIPGIAFSFSLRHASPANAATIEATTADAVTVRGDNQGAVTVVASYTRPNDGIVVEDTSQLTLTAPPPRVTRVEVSPATATINRGNTRQFTATAFGTNNQPVAGVAFTWTSSNPAVGGVDSNGLAIGAGVGATTVTATASDGMGGTVSDTATLTVQVPLVINEILADVPIDDDATTNVEGDANRDGLRSSDDDEFIEVLNSSNASVDVSGVFISDSTGNRFTFPADTTLAPGRAVIVFGGGLPSVGDPNFGGALVLTVANSVSSSSTLSLANTGDTVTIKLPVSGTDIVIDSHSYETEGGHDQSLTRSPDSEIGKIGGSFVAHLKATNAAGRKFSPGTRIDGTPFGSPSITRIAISPSAASIYVGATRQLTARAFSNAGGDEVEIQNVSFIWDSSDATKAMVAPLTGEATATTGIAAGNTTIRAQAGGQSGTATLTVKPTVASIEMTPDSASIPATSSQTFTATARDSDGNVIPGIVFSFSLRDASPANAASITGKTANTVNVRGNNQGSVTVVASYPRPNDGMILEDLSQLTITAPPPRVTRIEVSPSTATINRGQVQQFTATAFGTNNQPVAGVIFSWTSSDEVVGGIDSNGLATSVGIGTTTITATAPDGTGGTVSDTATLNVRIPLIINEILGDVPLDNDATTAVIEGDANRDGARDSGDDEFVELLNNSNAPVDISGVVITDATNAATSRFTFPAGTILAAGRAVVIFGGAQSATFNADDPNFGGALVLTVPGTATLGLNDTGDTVTVKLNVGGTDVEIAQVAYGGAGNPTAPSNQSLARSPDSEIGATGGNFVAHNSATNAAGRIFSPGTRIDGTPFGSPPITRIEVLPATASIYAGAAQGFIARAFSNTSSTEIEVSNVSFIWDSSDQTKAMIAPTTGASTTAQGMDAGSLAIRARVGGQEGVAALTVKAVVASIELLPETAGVFTGNSQTFTATARDANGNATSDSTFGFSLRNASPANAATITGTTRNTVTVHADQPGSVTVVAHDTQPGGQTFEDTSLLTITAPPPRITRVEVSPAAAAINRGNMQQFAATAFDENNRMVSSVSFDWSSSNPAVGDVDAYGLARGTGLGTVTISAKTSDRRGGTVSGTAMLTVEVPLVINEALARVPLNDAGTSAVEGDSNRDGVRSSDDDEFVEMFNYSDAVVDLSGIVIADSAANRFAFPANTMLAPGRAVIVFGGGTPPVNDPAFGGALILTTSSLSLADGGDTVTLKLPVAGTDMQIDSLAYGTGNPVPAPGAQSLTRSPGAEIGMTGGSFVAHKTAAHAAERSFSPGTRADGTPFGSPPVTRIEVSPASASIYVGSAQGFSARAFSDTNGAEVEVLNVSFIWNSDDTTKATIAPATGQSTIATGVAAGSPTIRAQAGGQESAATFTVNPIVASIKLLPETATISTIGSQTFTATARDSEGDAIPGLTFNFSLRDASPANAATIEATTANTVTVRGDQVGSVTIVASYTRPNDATIIEDTSALTITAPPPHVTRVEVSPATAAINRGQTQQFTATAFDDNDQIVYSSSFTWNSSDEAVGGIDLNGLATGVGTGTTTITATTSDGRGGTVAGTATLNVQIPLVINEILADPPGSASTDLQGDANRDSTRSGDDDEFIELLNNSHAPVNLSGVIISDSTTRRFTFPPNTTLAAGRALLLFGGGMPPVDDPAFGGALILKTNSLGLGNSGDTVTIKLPVAGMDVPIAAVTYGETGNPPAPADQSLTRSPDAQVGTTGGNFLAHLSATNAAGRRFSPGTRTDGTPFGSPPVTRIEVTPATASIFVGATQPLTARAFSNTSGTEVEVLNVSFIWESSDATKAVVAPTTGQSTTVTGVAAGSPTISALAGGEEGTAALTIEAVVASIDLQPDSATVTVGNAQTFTATARDANNDLISGLTFTFSLRDASPADAATIEATTRNTVTVRGETVGSATVVASHTQSGNGTFEDTSLVTINPAPPRPVRVELSPASATINRGGTQQFTATAFDENDQVIPGATFTWESNGESIATVDGNGSATGVGIGTVTITATTSDGLGGTVSGTATLIIQVPLVINEILADVPPDIAATTDLVEGDANRDGARGATEDEFVELLNNSNAPVDLSGVVITDEMNAATSRFTFPSGTTLAAGRAVVIFGGGAPPIDNPNFGGALVLTVADSATLSSTLSLGNTGDTVTVKLSVSGTDVVIDSHAYESEGNHDHSLTRSPDAEVGTTGGNFVEHTTVANAAGRVFSPGTRADGTPFGSPLITRIEVTPATASINIGSTQDFTAKAYSDTSGTEVEVSNVSFIWNSSGTGRATLSPTTGQSTTATAVATGDTTIHARAGGQDGTALLTVNPTLSVNNVTMSEDDSGTTTFTFTISLSSPAPASGVTFDIATADDTAQDGNPTGEDDDYAVSSLTGQTIAAGDQTFTFEVAVNGDTDIEPDETFFINITNVSGASVADDQGLGTIQNDDHPPALTVSNVSMSEGDGGATTFTFTVSLSDPAPAGGVTFDIATEDNTATVADNDYAANTLTGQMIAAGQQTYDFEVTVNGDTLVEPDETFFINVTNVNGATVAAGDDQGVGTILTDDSPPPLPTLSINDVTTSEGDGLTTTFTFTVSLSSPAPAGGVTFDIATQNDTATIDDGDPATIGDNDYVANSLPAQTIPEGSQTYTFDVTVNGDLVVEPDETFFVNVTNVSGANVSDSQGLGTIQNDDTPQLVISQVYGGGNNSGATFRNDFVELFNRGATTVSFAITPYSVQYASSAGNFSSANKLDLTSVTLTPGQYFLISLAGGTTNGAAIPTADATNTSINMSATDGKVALVIGTTVLSGSGCPIGPTVADFIGYGSANCSEGSTTGTLNATRSARRTNSCTDTNNNLADFTVVTNPSAPRNSAMPPAPCP